MNVGDHAKHIRQVAVVGFIFEVDNDNSAEVRLTSDGVPLSEILLAAGQAAQGGVVVVLDHPAVERDLDQCLQTASRPFRFGKASWSIA